MERSETSLYLELLKKVLTGNVDIHAAEQLPLHQIKRNVKNSWLFPLNKFLGRYNYSISKTQLVDREKRFYGYDWPAQADTMIGIHRLNHIEACIRTVIQQNIPGDFIETGVWRGGAVIFMRAVLKELNENQRKVWVADSFKGLPAPNTNEFPADGKSTLHTQPILTAGLEEVKNNFKKYDLLDEQVLFLEGWFRDTLPTAPIEKLALLRLDGDLYESTWQALENLYPKLSPGGFIIVDDYNAFDFCRAAVNEYRVKHYITEEIIKTDDQAVYWQKVK